MSISPLAIAERLNPLLKSAFPDADVDAVGPETDADDVAGWDSMAHVSLVVSIEDEFGIRFEPEEITASSNVGELIALIERKVNLG